MAEGTKVQRGGPVASLKSWVSRRCRESLERERGERERDSPQRQSGFKLIWNLSMEFFFPDFNFFFDKNAIGKF